MTSTDADPGGPTRTCMHGVTVGRRSRALLRSPRVAAAVVLVGLVVLGASPSYTVSADFQDASGLVTGNQVMIGPATVGTVQSIGLTPQRAGAQSRSASTPTSARCTRGRSRGSTRTRCRGSPTSTSCSSRARAAPRRSPSGGADPTAEHVLVRQPRPAVRHARPAHPARAAQLHPGRGGEHRGQGPGGQPDARYLAPALVEHERR